MSIRKRQVTYDSIRADTAREGYPWSALRDVEWDVTNNPIYGKPFCSEWWQGIQQSILNELGDLDLLSAAAEPGWDPAPRRDAVIQIALINSPPRWTTRGYDFAYGNMVDFSVGEPGVMVSVQNAAQQGLAAYGLGKNQCVFCCLLKGIFGSCSDGAGAYLNGAVLAIAILYFDQPL